MKPEQKIVAIGAAGGVALMVLAVWGLTAILPAAEIADEAAARPAYALRANVVALLPLFVMIVTIANGRFLSDGIDPTRRAESRAQEVNGRVASNTLEQTFIFAVASLALATVVPLDRLQVLWACAIVFVIARSIFWIGYRIHPLYRAPGMSSTAYMNLGILLYVLYAILR